VATGDPPGAPEATGGYVALGASNTCGHHVRLRRTFRFRIADHLRRRGLIAPVAERGLNHYNRCVAAMGPTYAAMCFDAIMPAGARYATVEYLPNLGGDNRTLPRVMRALRGVMHGLAGRGVRTVVVEVFPEWATADLRRNHEATVQMAASFGFPVVRVDFNKSRFVADGTHLSEEGHRHVTAEVMDRFLRYPTAVRPVGPAPASRPTQCDLGRQLGRAVLRATRFQQVDIGAHGHPANKFAYASTGPGAELALCIRGMAHTRVGRVSLGFMKSHLLNKPVLGRAKVLCRGGCTCDQRTKGRMSRQDSCLSDPECSYEGLSSQQKTVTDFATFTAFRNGNGTAGAGALAGPGQDGCPCEMVIRNPVTQDGRHRVILRALVMTDEASMTSSKSGPGGINMWTFAQMRQPF